VDLIFLQLVLSLIIIDSLQTSTEPRIFKYYSHQTDSRKFYSFVYSSAEALLVAIYERNNLQAVVESNEYCSGFDERQMTVRFRRAVVIA